MLFIIVSSILLRFKNLKPYNVLPFVTIMHYWQNKIDLSLARYPVIKLSIQKALMMVYYYYKRYNKYYKGNFVSKTKL